MKSLKIVLSVLAVMLVWDCTAQKCSCGTEHNVTKEQIYISQIISDGNIGELKKVDPAMLNCSENYRESYLVYAVRNRQIEIIKYLIGIGGDVNAPNESGGNALHYCAGDTALIALLVVNGIDINVQDIMGRTPIMRSAQQGKMEAVKYLIDKDADLHLKDYEGKTVVDFAHGGRSKTEKNKIYKPIKEFLKSKGATSGYILREAVITNDVNAVQEILESNSSKPDAKDQFGSTVLVYTCNVEILSLLFEHGLDLNIKNQDDLTGLMYAVRRGCYQAVEFYLEKGVDINAKQGDRTALDNATSGKIADLLIANGARKGKE